MNERFLEGKLLVRFIDDLQFYAMNYLFTYLIDYDFAFIHRLLYVRACCFPARNSWCGVMEWFWEDWDWHTISSGFWAQCF